MAKGVPIPELGERLLTIKQAAALLSVSQVSLRRWTNEGLLASMRVGGKRERRFREADLLAFMEFGSGGVAAPATTFPGVDQDAAATLFLGGIAVGHRG